jgi:hypothetical protein
MGATEDSVARLAAGEGLEFRRGASLPWLTNKGHLAEGVAGTLDEQTLAALRSIYHELGGDESLLASKRSGSDPRIDLLLGARALAIEVDEIQHFTTDRMRTLELYPPDADVLFNVDEYRAAIRLWHQRADRYRASKPTRDFPFVGGRRAQRAYFDAFRDLVAPSFGLRVLRLPAPECDGALAYQRLHAALEAAP